MAKTDNLKDFLTDVADAIREKSGESGLINPQDFSARIAAIQTGGGGAVAVSANDVNFRDYDGTILHSYTKDEFLALSAMPGLPTREGLTCQGWNCSFEDAVAYVTDNGRLEVGATYITDDGKTRLYIRIAAEGRMDVPLYFSQTSRNGVVIDWGDGSETQRLSGTSKQNVTHKYQLVGDYCITLSVNVGTLDLGHGTSGYCVLGSTADASAVYCNMLQKVEIGEGVTKIDQYAFSKCYSLASIVIPQNVSVIGAYAFYYCYSLASIVIPQNVKSFSTDTFRSCYSLASVVFPQSVSGLNSSLFATCNSLASVVIPQGATTVSTNLFDYCYSLASVVIPQSVTVISSNAFQSCYSLASIRFPQGVTNIYSSAFKKCYSMGLYDFSQLTGVPVLDSYAFTNIPSDCKIIVPDALYDEWIAATNWSTYASYIIKKSDWDAQNA